MTTSARQKAISDGMKRHWRGRQKRMAAITEFLAAATDLPRLKKAMKGKKA